MVDKKWFITFDINLAVSKKRMPNKKDIKTIKKGIERLLSVNNGCFVANIDGNPVQFIKIELFSIDSEKSKLIDQYTGAIHTIDEMIKTWKDKTNAR